MKKPLPAESGFLESSRRRACRRGYLISWIPIAVAVADGPDAHRPCRDEPDEVAGEAAAAAVAGDRDELLAVGVDVGLAERVVLVVRVAHVVDPEGHDAGDVVRRRGCPPDVLHSLLSQIGMRTVSPWRALTSSSICLAQLLPLSDATSTGNVSHWIGGRVRDLVLAVVLDAVEVEDHERAAAGLAQRDDVLGPDRVGRRRVRAG